MDKFLFPGFWFVTVLIYFNALNILVLASGSPLKLAQVSFWCAYLHQFFKHFFTFWYKIFQAHLIPFLPILGIYRFFKEPWYLLVQNDIRTPKSGVLMLTAYKMLTTDSMSPLVSPFNWQSYWWQWREICCNLTFIFVVNLKLMLL